MNGFRPSRYHLLAIAVIAVTAASLFILGRSLSRIEASLPLYSLHQERDFSAFLLDISRLEAALRVAAAAPTPEHLEHASFSLDLVVLRNRDNQSLYRQSEFHDIAAFHRSMDAAIAALEQDLARHAPLQPHLEQVEALRHRLQTLNDTVFQSSMERASAQQQHLGRLGQALPLVLLLLGSFGVGLVYFALRQQRIIQSLGEREAQLQESEVSYRGLFNNVSEAIYIQDESSRFLDVNLGAEKMYGYGRAEMIGQYPALVAAPDRNDFGQLQARFQRALAGTPQQFEFWGQRKNGEVFPKQVWLNRGRYFGRDVVIAIATDISERKQVEAELRRSNSELEQFAYAISHDMRQPLRMISSYQQLLGKALQDQLNEDTREYLNFATDGAKRLDQMLVGLLDYSRVGRKTAPLDWIESRSPLDEALHYLKPALDEAGATVRITGDWPRIHASRDELMRLFQNLVGNAVKYRLPDRPPEVTITASVAGTDTARRWTVQVSDNGIGINPSQIPRLFQVFQRLQSHARYEGAGVGLALCRKIAEHHGGCIHAESAGEGQGSTFICELPLPSAEGEPAPSPLREEDAPPRSQS